MCRCTRVPWAPRERALSQPEHGPPVAGQLDQGVGKALTGRCASGGAAAAATAVRPGRLGTDQLAASVFRVNGDGRSAGTRGDRPTGHSEN